MKNYNYVVRQGFDYKVEKPQRQSHQISLPYSENGWQTMESVSLTEALEVVKQSVKEANNTLRTSLRRSKYDKLKKYMKKYNANLIELVQTCLKIETQIQNGQYTTDEEVVKGLVVEAKKLFYTFYFLLNNPMEQLTYNERTKYELFTKQTWKFYHLVFERLQIFMNSLPAIDWSQGLTEEDLLMGLSKETQDKVIESGLSELTGWREDIKVFAKVCISPFRTDEYRNTLSMGSLERYLVAKKLVEPNIFEQFLKSVEIQEFEEETAKVLSGFQNSIDNYEELRLIKGTKDILNFYEDSEYITEETETTGNRIETKDYLVSYQTTVSLFGFVITFVFITTNAYSENRQDIKLSFDEIYKYILEKLGFEGSRKKKSSTVNMARVAHNGIVDLPKLETHECRITEEDIKKKGVYSKVFQRHLSQVQGGLCTANGSIPYDIQWYDTNNHKFVMKQNISVRDTMAQSVSGKGLASIGEAIGFKKLHLLENTYKDMGKFFREDFHTFMAYAMRDTEICALYTMALFGTNKDIPLTLMSRTTKVFQDLHKQEALTEYTAEALQGALENMKGQYSKAVPLLKNEEMTDEAYDILFRGVRKIDKEDKMVEDCQSKYKYFTRVSEVLPINNYAEEYIALGADSYAGGLNCSYYYGWVLEETYDYDLEQAYGSAMANLPDIAFEEKPLKEVGYTVLDSMDKAEEVLWTVNGKKIPHTHPILCRVLEVKNVDNQYISAMGIHLNGTIIFTDNFEESIGAGLDQLATAPVKLGTTIHSILSMGGTVVLRYAKVLPLRKNKEGKTGCSFANTISRFCNIRKNIQETQGKKSMLDQLLKLIINSTYGKTAQSVKPKKVYNFLNATDENDGGSELGQSSITNTIFATLITETARTALINTVYELMSMGYKVYSITTDGFISNAPLNVLLKTTALGLADYYKEGLKRIGNNAEMWQVKHSQSVLYAGTTRVNVGFKKVEIFPNVYAYVHTDKCVFARGGWKITEHEWQLDGCSHELDEQEWKLNEEDTNEIDLYKRQLYIEVSKDSNENGEVDFENYSFIVEPKDNEQLEAFVFMRQLAQGKVRVCHERKQTNIREWAIDNIFPHTYYTEERTISLNPDGKRSLILSSLEEKSVSLNGEEITLGCVDTKPLLDLEEMSKLKKVLSNKEVVYRSREDFETLMLRVSREKKVAVLESNEKVMTKDILMAFITNQMSCPYLEGLSQKEVLNKVNTLLLPEDRKLTMTDYKNLYNKQRHQKLTDDYISYLYKFTEGLEEETYELPY